MDVCKAYQAKQLFLLLADFQKAEYYYVKNKDGIKLVTEKQMKAQVKITRNLLCYPAFNYSELANLIKENLPGLDVTFTHMIESDYYSTFVSGTLETEVSENSPARTLAAFLIKQLSK